MLALFASWSYFDDGAKMRRYGGLYGFENTEDRLSAGGHGNQHVRLRRTQVERVGDLPGSRGEPRQVSGGGAEPASALRNRQLSSHPFSSLDNGMSIGVPPWWRVGPQTWGQPASGSTAGV